MKLTMTVKEAQEALGLGRTTLYALMKANRLAKVKVGRRTLLTVDSVRRLVDPNNWTGE